MNKFFGKQKNCKKCFIGFVAHSPRQFYCKKCSSVNPVNLWYKNLKDKNLIDMVRKNKFCKCGKRIWNYSKHCKSCIGKIHVNFKKAWKKVLHGKNHHLWKGDKITADSGRNRAQKMYKLKPCEVCGKNESERHHKDSNPLNNSFKNIMFLCRKHHMLLDGRIPS